MKILILLFFFTNIIFLINGQEIIEDNFFRHPIHSRFYGYYLPSDFVNSFEETRNYLLSKELINNYQYIYIRIDKNGIWTKEPLLGDGFHENLVQTVNDLRKFQYKIGENNEIIIININGERYKKISNDFDYNIPAIDNYLGRIVLHELIENGDIMINNNIITIPSLNYEKFIINTWEVTEEIYASLNINGFALYLDGFYNRGLYIFIEINNNKYTLFERVTWNTGQISRRIIMEKNIVEKTNGK